MSAVLSSPLIARRSLWLNAAWAFGGNAVYSGCQWLILIAIVRLGDPQQVGAFSLGFAITAPLMLLASLSLRTIQATDSVRRHTFEEYLGLRLVMASIALALVIAIAFAGQFGRMTSVVIVMVGVAKFSELLSDIQYGLFQQHERMEAISHSLILRGVLALSASSVAMGITHNVAYAVSALAVSWIFVLLVVDVPRSQRILTLQPQANPLPTRIRTFLPAKPSFRYSAFKPILWVAIPFGLSTSVNSLVSNVPRYALQHQVGERGLGVYAALTYLIIAGMTVISAIAQSSLPRLSSLVARREVDSFEKLLTKLIFIGFALGAGTIIFGIVFGRVLLSLMYGPDYASYSGLFVWVCITGAVIYVGYFFDIGLFAVQRFSAMLPLNLVGLVAAITASVTLVPNHGLHGAVWATLIAAVIQNSVEFFLLRRVVTGMRD